MPHDTSGFRTLPASYDIEDFLNAIEKMDINDIISLADQEATAAWRSAYQLKKCGQISNELPKKYESALEELIRFLSASVTYRPSEMEPEVFDQFLRLRESVYV